MAAYAQLGRAEQASRQLTNSQSQVPDFAERTRGDLVKKSVEREFIESNLEGLRKAGLELKKSLAAAGSRSQLLRGFYNLAIRVQGHPPDLLKPILDDHEFSRTHHGRRMSF